MRDRYITRLVSAGMAAALLTVPAHALTAQQAGELLSTYYIDEVPEDVLRKPTAEEMVEALGDPYTVYFTPEEYAGFMASMEDGSVVGIGISAVRAENGLRVDHVFSGSPAEEAGMKTGDVIVEVDGHNVSGESLDAAVERLRGEIGTRVEIAFLHGDVVNRVQMCREKVVIPATTVRLEEDHIGIIQCNTFGADTAGHFHEAIETNQSKADGWIVDLRKNGGGTIDAAFETVAMFDGAGISAYLMDHSGEIQAYGSDRERETLYSVIGLLSPDTASAAELFAGALRDRNLGINVGTRTYGKGVAQSVFDGERLPDYFPDGDALKITSFRFFSPAGATNDMVGVIPHLFVPAEQAEDVARMLCASNPTGDTNGMLRLDMGWRWFIDVRDLQPEKKGTLSLLLEAIPANVKLWKGIGGSDGWERISPAEAAKLLGVDYRSRDFGDTAYSPYQMEISILATYGMVDGDGSGAFHPQKELTRAELCALLVKVLNLPYHHQDSRFDDVAETAWYSDDVNAMAEMGLVNGVAERLFAPDMPVTHEQMVTVMGRLAQWISMSFFTPEGIPQGELEGKELADWSDWARESAWLLAESQTNIIGNPLNILWAPIEEIDPHTTATREEAAMLVYTLLSYCNVIPV